MNTDSYEFITNLTLKITLNKINLMRVQPFSTLILIRSSLGYSYFLGPISFYVQFKFMEFLFYIRPRIAKANVK